MRPIIDSKGRIWSGAMGHNALVMFDPQTETFASFTVPDGKYGIMGLVITPDDTIWFTEQNANYIGHFDPEQQHFDTYPLPTVTTPDPADEEKTLTLPSAPNGIALDADGNIWFTEMNRDTIGMLNSETKEIEHYQIGLQPTVQELTPYGITVDPTGTIWFTLASTNELGRFDPPTGEFSLIAVEDPGSPLMEVTSDEQGRIWATTFRTPHVLSYDPVEVAFTTYTVSEDNTVSGGLYDLAIDEHGIIWVTVTMANQIARLDITTNEFTYYDIPTSASVPYGLVIAPDSLLWFTESSGNKLGSFNMKEAVTAE